MPTYEVVTPRHSYSCVVERGVLARAKEYLPPTGKVFVVTTQDVWDLHGPKLGLNGATVMHIEGGERNKRLHTVEAIADRMVEAGCDRSSLVVAFGGGIAGDVGGFAASIFMRGLPVVQIPTTLLAQVDAAVGGKTGVNLASGKNLIGTFHQPSAVLIDPEVLRTLPEREYRAGLFEVVKHGIIASKPLFDLMAERRDDVLSQSPDAVEYIVAESVRIKSEVVSADEKEGDLRRILNFGHTLGHALEVETGYEQFLHGEAVAFGMIAATHLARIGGLLSGADCDEIIRVVQLCGPIPSVAGIDAEALVRRTAGDKKTVGGKVHFVLPDRIGHVVVRSGIPEEQVLEAVRAAVRA